MIMGQVHRKPPPPLPPPPHPSYCHIFAIRGTLVHVHILRKVHRMSRKCPCLKVKRIHVHAAYTSEAQACVRFILLLSIFNYVRIFLKVHQMTSNRFPMWHV